MIDTHCHLNFHSFKKKYSLAAKEAAKIGVNKIINVGAKLDSSIKAVEIAEEIPFCFAAIGIHPHHALDYPNQAATINNLNQVLTQAQKKKIVAIGECGLDYHEYNPQILVDKTTQKLFFQLHLRLAIKNHLPLIIHCRDAYEDLLKIVKTPSFSSLRAVLHCFQGSAEILKQFLNLGFFIGFDGYITYHDAKREFYRDLVAQTPINRLLAETDSPWLTPEPKRGNPNTPANVKFIYERIGEIKNLPLSSIEKQIDNNAQELFFK